jgi:hypothetical protein
MGMEKRITLNAGVEIGGCLVKDFTLRPLTVGDLIEAHRHPESAQNGALMNALCLARRLSPQLSPEAVGAMYFADYEILLKADEEMGRELAASFRTDEKSADCNTGAS